MIDLNGSYALVLQETANAFNERLIANADEATVPQDRLPAALKQAARLKGQYLADNIHPAMQAFSTGDYTEDEIIDLEQGFIPDSFYPSDNGQMGVFTEEGINKFFNFLNQTRNFALKNALVSNFAKIFIKELYVGQGDVIYSVPFYSQKPIADAVDALVESEDRGSAYQKLDLFDIEAFVEADEEKQAAMLEEAGNKNYNGQASDLSEVIGGLLNKFTSKGITEDQATKALINLQKVLQVYKATAEAF